MLYIPPLPTFLTLTLSFLLKVCKLSPSESEGWQCTSLCSFRNHGLVSEDDKLYAINIKYDVQYIKQTYIVILKYLTVCYTDQMYIA